MGDLSQPDQEKKEPAAEHLPAENWETAFSRASDAYPVAPGSPPRAPSRGGAIPWIKALLPLTVILLYVVFKLVDSPRGPSGAFWDTPAPVDSLSGVQPAAEPVQIERAVREKLVILEDLYRRGQWADIRRVVAEETNPAVRDHPIIRAMELLSRARAGERNLEVERALENAEISIRASGEKFAPLLQELRLAHVEQILSRTPSRENFAYNIDEIHRLLGTDASTDRAVQVRGKVARTFENFADELTAAGEGIIQNDLLKMREARQYHQSGLRYIVKADRWYELQPISPSAGADVERIVQKIRDLNRRINGPALPFTANDSHTWTGKKGDPIHDAPVR